MRKHRMMLIVAAALACSCDKPGGGGDVAANASVTGRLSGQDFDFTPGEVQATVDATDPNASTLTVILCDGSCSGGNRMVTAAVQAPAAELRAGGSFSIGDRSTATARFAADSGNGPMAATAGEVVIDSTDLREGGRTVGTFQLEFGQGSMLAGFFEAPLNQVTGDVAVLNH